MSELDSKPLPARAMAAGESTRTTVPVVVLLVSLLSVLLFPLWNPRPTARAGIRCEGTILGVTTQQREASLVALHDTTCTPLVAKADDSPCRVVVLVAGTQVLECAMATAGDVCVERKPIQVPTGAEIRMRLIEE